MCKSEIFAKILRIVSLETEVSEDLILSKCKRSDIVDSRGIMVVILSEYKFSESQISSFTGFTQQSINKLKNIDPDRIRRNYLLKVIVRNIRESLGMPLRSL
nr:MAG TPA: chromosomal replication initiator protein [Caudoviricetes sp.]